MNNEQKLKQIKKYIQRRIQILYNSNEDNVYENYLAVITIDDMYKKITGKNLFNIEKFCNERKDLSMIASRVLSYKDIIALKESKENIKYLNNRPLLYEIGKEIYEHLNNLKTFETKYKNKLSDKDKNKLIINFLDYYCPDYRFFYEKMLESGKVLFLDYNMNNFWGLTYFNPDFNGADDCFIAISKFDYDLFFLNVLAHEVGHAVEYKSIKENCTKDEFMNFQKNSLFGETRSMLASKSFYNFLEEEGFNKKEISFLRANELLTEYSYLIQNMNVSDKTKYTCGVLLSTYMDNIKSGRRYETVMKVFDINKVAVNDYLEMRELIGCNDKVLKKSFQNYIRKC